MKIDTKFDLGQVVYHAFTRFDSRAHAEECKTCEGVGTDLVPRFGMKHEIKCPQCRGMGRVVFAAHVPCVRTLTIGMVRVEVVDATQSSRKGEEAYMARESGLGSGTVYHGGTIFADEESAKVAAMQMASEANFSRNEELRKKEEKQRRAYSMDDTTF